MPDRLYLRIAERLKSVREAKSLTQHQVAILLGRPQSYVSRCEKGQKRLEVAELKAFCEVYGIPASFFLEE